MGALTDMTARLIEKGIPSWVEYREGKPVVLIGPYPSKAEADARKAKSWPSWGPTRWSSSTASSADRTVKKCHVEVAYPWQGLDVEGHC
jgi:hypothetical protein